MIFSELYSAYYSTVASLISGALEGRITNADISRASFESAFDESAVYIEQALKSERWQVLTKNGETPLEHAPSTPETLLERRFLKAVLSDPRMKLFGISAAAFPALDGVEPLFTDEDFEIFDRFGDGDPYDDSDYFESFGVILRALREKKRLEVFAESRKGRRVRLVMTPQRLEYSEKDDKFRLTGCGAVKQDVVNLARIRSVRIIEGEAGAFTQSKRAIKRVCFELYDRRRALERVLLHFAHLEKQTEKLDEGKYLVTLYYDEADETEMVIRLLSFGPMIKIIEPESFVSLIKQRLISQMRYNI